MTTLPGPWLGRKILWGRGGGCCPKDKGDISRSREYSNRLVPGLPRGAPRSPGPRSKLGCAGRPLGVLRAAAAGFPQNGSNPRGLGSRAGSIPARRHRRKLRDPGRDNCRLNGGDAAPGSWGPRGVAREGLGDRPMMTPLPRPPRAPCAVPRVPRPVTRAHPAPTRPRRTPGPPSPSPLARPRHSPEFLHVCGRGLRRAKERVSARPGAPPARSVGSPTRAPARTPVPQWARQATAV